MSCFSRYSSSFVNDDLVFRMKTYLWLRTSPLCSTNRTLFSSSGYFWLIKLGESIYLTTFVFIFVQERNGGGQFTVVFAAEMWCGSLEGKWTADLRSLAPLMPPTFNGRFRLSRKQARGFQCRFFSARQTCTRRRSSPSHRSVCGLTLNWQITGARTCAVLYTLSEKSRHPAGDHIFLQI